MTKIVMKFGGTSVESPEKIENVATRVKREKDKGHDIVVVVSAMGKTTDELSNLAFGLAESPSDRKSVV